MTTSGIPGGEPKYMEEGIAIVTGFMGMLVSANLTTGPVGILVAVAVSVVLFTVGTFTPIYPSVGFSCYMLGIIGLSGSLGIAVGKGIMGLLM